MKLVIQRVDSADVLVKAQSIAKISTGFVILVGIHKADTQKDVDYLVKKVAKLRVFEEDGTDKKMNNSIADVGGSILSISQFTLYADTKKGNRPSFQDSAEPDLAKTLYEKFNEGLRNLEIKVLTGIFGAEMKINLVNNGPVTIVIDTKK